MVYPLIILWRNILFADYIERMDLNTKHSLFQKTYNLKSLNTCKL